MAAASGAFADHQGAGTYVSSHFRLHDEGAVTSYLDRKGLVYRVSGDQAVVKECPLCSKPTRGQADNMWKLYLKVSDGAFHCHRCGNGGSWFDFKRRMGDIGDATVADGADMLGFRNGGASGSGGGNAAASAAAGRAAAAAAAAAAEPEPTASMDPKEPLRWMSALFEDSTYKPVRKYLLEERGLTEHTLRTYLVGATKHRFRMEDGSWQSPLCVTFPMFATVGDAGPGDTQDRRRSADTGGESGGGGGGDGGSLLSVPRAKLRAIDHKRLQSMYPRGGGWGLFGLHTVPADADFVILTEGEYDAMAVFQATGLPAVSLPNGCRSLPVQLLPLLERFKYVYLWMDNDVPGQEGAEKLAGKLGAGRCFLVRGQGLPKDANDALRAGADLRQILATAKPLPHAEITTFDELREDVLRELSDHERVSGTPYRCMPALQNLIRGHRAGELTILTGRTGSGKTTLLNELSLDLCAQGVPTLWGSFEIKNVRLLKQMLTQYAGKSLIGTSEDEFAAVAEGFASLPLYFLRFFGSTDVDKVLDAMEYATYVYDVEHIVLDNLQFMLSGAGTGQNGRPARGTYDRFDSQERALEKFRQFATVHNVHISLVIHPRKEPDENSLSLSSVFGTAKATQEADNVVILQTTPKGKYIEVKKNRFSGDLGKVPVVFDVDSQTFVQGTPAGPGVPPRIREDGSEDNSAAAAVSFMAATMPAVESAATVEPPPMSPAQFGARSALESTGGEVGPAPSVAVRQSFGPATFGHPLGAGSDSTTPAFAAVADPETLLRTIAQHAGVAPVSGDAARRETAATHGAGEPEVETATVAQRRIDRASWTPDGQVAGVATPPSQASAAPSTPRTSLAPASSPRPTGDAASMAASSDAALGLGFTAALGASSPGAAPAAVSEPGAVRGVISQPAFASAAWQASATMLAADENLGSETTPQEARTPARRSYAPRDAAPAASKEPTAEWPEDDILES